MTIRELINELIQYDPDQKVEICTYTSIGDTGEMTIYNDLVDKNGNTPCEVHKEISNIGLGIDNKTVYIS